MTTGNHNRGQDQDRDEEYVLRHGMRDFARTQAGPGPGLRSLLDRAHRARRRQRAVRAGAAGFCVIAVATGAFALGQRPAADTAGPAAPHTSATATPAPSLTPRTEDDRSKAGLSMPEPAHPVTGKPYPYNWYSHCGMVYIVFAGQTWKADGPVTVPQAHPDAHGVVTEPLNVPGYVTITSPTTLRFDAPTYITGVLLHTTDEERPLCE